MDGWKEEQMKGDLSWVSNNSGGNLLKKKGKMEDRCRSTNSLLYSLTLICRYGSKIDNNCAK